MAEATRTAGLTDDQVRQFHEEGYFLVEDLFDPDLDIKPIMDEYAGVLDNLAERSHSRKDPSAAPMPIFLSLIA